MKIFLATRNKDKILEIRHIFSDLSVEFVSFDMIPELSGCDAPETGETLFANALQKATYYMEKAGLPVISDDTGLFVKALDGAPGVYSSRFAGEEATYGDNVRLILEKMHGSEDRSAYFETVAMYLDTDGDSVKGIGRLPGKITCEARGEHGFGYDPVFLVDGSGKTLAQMLPEEKNSLSHRYRAMIDLRSKLLEKGII